MKLTMVDGNFEGKDEEGSEETVLVTICISNSVQQFFIRKKDCEKIRKMYESDKTKKVSIDIWQTIYDEYEEVSLSSGQLFFNTKDLVWVRYETDPQSPVV